MNSPEASSLPDYHDVLLWTTRHAARWKSTAADFQVDEIFQPQLDPRGEQVLLQVEKSGQNTHWVAREVARFAGVRDLDVAYLGMKDRQAVTRQYFSIYFGGRPEPDWTTLALPGVSVRFVGRIARKLRRGEHAGNRFRVVVRFPAPGEVGALSSAAVEDIGKKLRYLQESGFPNAFGPQRFGTRDENVVKAAAWLSSRRRLRDRHLQGIHLSAIRASFFNATLKERIRRSAWNLLLPGDTPVAAACCSLAPEPRDRCLVPAGTLPGDSRFGAGLRGEIERQVAAPAMQLLEGLHAMGVRSQNRALVARCADLEWHWQELSRLTLSFTLGVGCYASTFLDQLFLLNDCAEDDLEGEYQPGTTSEAPFIQ